LKLAKHEAPASCGGRRLPGGVFISSSLAVRATEAGYEEFILPSLEPATIYAEKAGNEVLGQMYTFPDKKGRQLCLRPEGTATCQILADTVLKSERDVKLWYLATCWRYERPQAGRYREFLQFGVEVLNPRWDVRDELVELATGMVKMFTDQFEVSKAVKRGLAYYVEDGFEISCPALGAQKQVCGGGSYKQGCGFALGVDRLMLV
jgi:histidyl-tRNA synthetase